MLDQALTLFRPGFFHRLRVQEGSLGTPLVISGTIEASPMKLSTVIVTFKAYQNTQRNFQKSDVIAKTMGKFGPKRSKANDISI